MLTRKVVFTLTVTLGLFIARRPATCAVTMYEGEQRESLRGIMSIDVLVGIHPTGTETQDDKTLETFVRTDAELKLRLAGIVVRSEDRIIYPYGSIAINVSWLNTERERVYTVELSFCVQVYLLHDTTWSIHTAFIWDRSYFGIAPKSKFRDDVRSAAKDLTDIFINDYLAVNTKDEDKEP